MALLLLMLLWLLLVLQACHMLQHLHCAGPKLAASCYMHYTPPASCVCLLVLLLLLLVVVVVLLRYHLGRQRLKQWSQLVSCPTMIVR